MVKLVRTETVGQSRYYSGGTQTALIYFGSNARFLADSCALYTSIRSKSRIR